MSSFVLRLKRLLVSTELVQRADGQALERRYFSSLRALLLLHLSLPSLLYFGISGFVRLPHQFSLQSLAPMMGNVLADCFGITAISLVVFFAPLVLHVLFESRHQAYLSGQISKPSDSLPGQHYTFNSQWDRNDPRVIASEQRLLPFLLMAAVYLSFCFQILLNMLATLPKISEYSAPVGDSRAAFFLNAWQWLQVLLFVQFVLMVPMVLRRIHRSHYYLPEPNEPAYSGFWILYNGHSIAIQMVVKYGIWRFALSYLNFLPVLTDNQFVNRVDQFLQMGMFYISIVSLNLMYICLIAEVVRTALHRFEKRAAAMRAGGITLFVRLVGVAIPPFWAVAHLGSGGSHSLLANMTVIGFAVFLSLIWLSSPLSYLNRDFLELGFTTYECVSTLVSGGFKWLNFWQTILKGRSALSALILFWLVIACILATLSQGIGVHEQAQEVQFPSNGFLVNESALIVDGIPIEELGYLALLPYLKRQPSNDFLGWQTIGEPCENDSYCYWTLVNEERKTRVVSFPGGISHRELALNCALYGNGIIFKMVSAIFPSSCFEDLPPALDLMASVPNLFWQNDIDTLIPRMAQTIYHLSQTNRSTYRTFFVGHGRGGSFAALVGAGLGIRTVIFGSPGIEMLRHRFSSVLPLLVKREALTAILVSVTNHYDFVSSIDSIPGVKFYQLPCTFDISNPTKCHLASTIFAALVQKNVYQTFKQERIFLSTKAIQEIRSLEIFSDQGGKQDFTGIVPACWGEDPISPLMPSGLPCGPVIRNSTVHEH